MKSANQGSEKKTPSSVPQEKRQLSLKPEILPVANVSLPVVDDGSKEQSDNQRGAPSSGEKSKIISVGKLERPKQAKGKTLESKSVSKLKSPMSGRHRLQEEAKWSKAIPMPKELVKN